MTAGAVAGVLVALGVVLALLFVTLRVLQRFAPAAGGGRARLPLEVVQRLSLGPKQGVAVVRVGARVLVVGTGEGGVQPLAELDGADLAGVLAPAPAGAPAGAPHEGRAGARFGEALRAALTQATRAAGGLLLIAGAARGGGAQAAPRPPAVSPAAPAAPAPAALPASTQNALVQSALAQAALRQAAVQQVTRAAPARVGAGAPAATTRGAPGVPAAPSPTPPTLSGPAPGFAARPPSTTAPPPPTSVVTVDTMVAKLAPTMDVRVGGGAGAAQGLRLSGTVGVVVMLGLLTLLPSLVLMMTGFTRILVVLQFLKQALGTQTAPPNQLVAGLALLLTGFVMAPTVAEINRTALQPWLGGQIQQVEMLDRGAKPLRAFMLRQTRERDVETFLELSRARADTAAPAPRTPDDVPLVVLTSAFVTSELRTAFQLGFALFLPFIVIDVVVSAVLTSMGMMMLPPAMVSLPFKLLLFVLVDGWTLVVQSLVQSFR
ncbi:hypothetical protein tb265_17790 [Gemmatimonadetes bacterium T265]|nr:hypothetical protein tb265_17790 [Gemmatimonadetes bacterium T265]